MTRGRTLLRLAAWGAASLPLAVAAVIQACYSATPNDGLVDAAVMLIDTGKMKEAATGTVGIGVTCEAGIGDIPPSNCHVAFPPGTTTEQCGNGGSCPAGVKPPSSCGDPTTCMPLAANKAPTYDFRMGALYLLQPSKLANPLIQGEVVTAGVTLNTPQCGNEQGMTVGLFNWIISLDTSKKQIITGGAPPVTDPSKGFCFVNTTVTPEGGAPIPVAPTTTAAEFGDAGVDGEITFSSTPVPVLNIPIFASATDLSNPIILPISGAAFHDVTISPDGNCIGDLNQNWAAGAAMCQDMRTACPKWYTNGSIAGYITLKDAQGVNVMLTGGTLCGLLVGKSSCTMADYKSGDYCSTSKKAGDCADSFWLSAVFSASAVTVNASGPAPCK